MAFPILRREGTEYCPLLMCEKCNEHTRHTKGRKVNWAFVANKPEELRFPRFRRMDLAR